jgi:type IV pilus assembly protein PilA
VFSDSSKRTFRTPQQPSAGLSYRLRKLSSDQSGFSLMEILAVLAIIGILAAVAIPSFLNQTQKGYDASAKQLVGTAETTAGLIFTDNDGSYEKVTAAELHKYESGIPIAEGSGNAWLSAATPEKSAYSVTVTAANTGDEFTLARNAGGEITRTCKSGPSKTGCSGAETGTW